jgi:hypothetical protein
MRYALSWIAVLCLGAPSWSGCGGSSDTSNNTIEWAASAAVKSEEQPNELFGFRIALSNSASSNVQWLTAGEQDDYKPAYSPDGTQIAFFRVLDYGDGPARTWKSKLCVMNADGSGYRELTNGDHADWHPYWSRDGSNQITFTRFGQLGLIPWSGHFWKGEPSVQHGKETQEIQPGVQG